VCAKTKLCLYKKIVKLFVEVFLNCQLKFNLCGPNLVSSYWWERAAFGGGACEARALVGTREARALGGTRFC